MKASLVVIGGGLSGLAAAIRAARFHSNILLLEQHSRLGGLNSYFYRNGTLFETGLHAITNYAAPGNKAAPLNRLLRQLKLRRTQFAFCEQYQSEVVFRGCASLKFSNDFELFNSEIADKFPQARQPFRDLLVFLRGFDPFLPAPCKSAKQFLLQTLKDPLLVDMILCPLMFYGSSQADDLDLSQFAIMFQAIYQEGLFRPQGTIKDFLDLLVDHYHGLGGTLRTGCGVVEIIHDREKARGVRLATGEEIECGYLLSTIGREETMHLLGDRVEMPATDDRRLAFVETIYQVPERAADSLPRHKTIIFYNDAAQFSYCQPDDFVDFSSGVICFPGSFQGLEPRDPREIRSTHLANYARWKEISKNTEGYRQQKHVTSRLSGQHLENLIGSFTANVVYENSFTPVTIERYTSKIGGAVYGSPTKTKDGDVGFTNLFLAGTDQGFLGIIGSMLSGVSIVNQHILPKL